MAMETIILGGGCFWCLEAAYLRIPGVHAVESGYSGGHVDMPSYQAVCSGSTGHAEVVKISFDPEIVSLREILSWFWKIHDPTTLNRQGADVGTQYRSVIYFQNEQQEAEALRQIQVLQEEKVFPDPIVTELSPLDSYFPAEAYHQDYYDRNPTQGYCAHVIAPKLEKIDALLKAKS